jgi:hypothetical protein
MAYYYLKLYHEILDDPKMGRLSDHLYRRVIEVFLIASASIERDGYLPPIDDIAWKLRTTPEELSNDFSEIEKTGIIKMTEPGRWYVTNFIKRQSAVTVNERVKRYREREHTVTPESNEIVTNRYTELRVKNLDIDIEENKKKQEFPAASSSPAIPTSGDLLRIYTAVTGMVAFPSGSYSHDYERLEALYHIKGGGLADYLRPFWAEWIGRNYGRTNTAWLDWAVAEKIPERRTEPRNNGKNSGVDETVKRLEALRNAKH